MKFLKVYIYSLLSASSFILWKHAPAYEFQSHTTITSAVEQHLQNESSQYSGKPELQITPPDHRLRLARCSNSLETFSPPGANATGKTTVGVRCDTPTPWTLYVAANIIIHEMVIVAARDLARGTVITQSDIKLAEHDTGNLLRGHFDRMDQVIGRTLKRSLRRDLPVTPSLLHTQKTIKRGQELTILSGSDVIQVRMKGKALKNGNPGDLIPVQNLTSKKKLEARVISAGIVRID